jgi:class 3 adenylate cyclase
MPRIPIFRLGSSAEELTPPRLASYTPALSLAGLQLGVDNLRHDVHLSTKFVEQTRLHVARLIMRYGNVESLLAAEAPETQQANKIIGSPRATGRPKTGFSDLKPLLAEMHVAALNRAKAEGNNSVDLLARSAILKFLRTELNLQFAQILERCRVMLKSYEGIRQEKALEYRERLAAFQVAKKIILRQTAQDLFRTLREIEKETLLRTRRSLFGNEPELEYQLFLNPLILSDDGRDTYLCAEYYVMLGNFDRDPDTFAKIRGIACEFLQSLNLQSDEAEQNAGLDAWLNVPENAQELVGAGAPDDSTLEGRSQKARLAAWLQLLERENVMEYVIASYEVVPLLAEYSQRINPQQLKNGLISREERERVEKLIKEHSKFSSTNFAAAVGRVANYRGADRFKVAGRFLRDFMLYHRDLRRLEVLNGAMDSINLIGNAKLRELSALNGTLYELLLPEEKKPSEEKVLRHVILKADVRDSSRLTRSLLERDMNPASYFSLNFYDPVNKLLQKYGAIKVFLEGDAIILAFLEREGEPPLAVSKACVLAREMIEIVRGYNQLSERAGLPALELGVGISYQDSPPMYLMDGEQRIMISDALNESDRLSSCNKRVRKAMEKMETPFNVYAFQTVSDTDALESPEDFIMKYNLSGIRMSAAAFQKLQQEISLAPLQLPLPALWGSEEFRLYSGLVPVGNDIFRKIVVRGSRIPQIDTHDFTLQHWTEKWYYEVCSNAAIYTALEGKSAAGK